MQQKLESRDLASSFISDGGCLARYFATFLRTEAPLIRPEMPVYALVS